MSKLWISRRMLVAETTLLRAYGGVGRTVRAQDAIRQGRRVLLRQGKRGSLNCFPTWCDTPVRPVCERSRFLDDSRS